MKQSKLRLVLLAAMVLTIIGLSFSLSTLHAMETSAHPQSVNFQFDDDEPETYANGSIYITDQWSERDTPLSEINIELANLTDGGFVVIYDDEVLAGHSSYLGKGKHVDFKITLEEAVEANSTVTAVLYRDSNSNQNFDKEQDKAYIAGADWNSNGFPINDTAQVYIPPPITQQTDTTTTPTTTTTTPTTTTTTPTTTTTTEKPVSGPSLPFSTQKIIFGIGGLIGIILIVILLYKGIPILRYKFASLLGRMGETNYKTHGGETPPGETPPEEAGPEEESSSEDEDIEGPDTESEESTPVEEGPTDAQDEDIEDSETSETEQEPPEKSDTTSEPGSVDDKISGEGTLDELLGDEQSRSYQPETEDTDDTTFSPDESSEKEETTDIEKLSEESELPERLRDDEIEENTTSEKDTDKTDDDEKESEGDDEEEESSGELFKDFNTDVDSDE